MTDKERNLARKLRKQRLQMLQANLNKCRIDISMHKLRTYGEVFYALGLQDQAPVVDNWTPDMPIDVKAFNELAFKLEDGLRRKQVAEIAAENNPETAIALPTDRSGIIDIDATVKNELDIGVNADHPMDKFMEWMPDTSKKQIAKLIPFQLKAAKDLMYKLFVLNYRAALLRAPVGSGKTFIYGQVIRWLWSMTQPWPLGKTFSPIPMLVVTKASIVEQTARVMEKQFGLDLIRNVRVLHYDALRSSIGERLLENIKIVEDAIVRIRWKWHLGLNPIFFVLDEAQSAKNEDSQQSRIVQAISEIEDPNVKIIFASATPFLKIAEAKYFCINAGIEYSVL